jgi:hypothetical protein
MPGVQHAVADQRQHRGQRGGGVVDAVRQAAEFADQAAFAAQLAQFGVVDGVGGQAGGAIQEGGHRGDVVLLVAQQEGHRLGQGVEEIAPLAIRAALGVAFAQVFVVDQPGPGR